jgi:hypothetical protein
MTQRATSVSLSCDKSNGLFGRKSLELSFTFRSQLPVLICSSLADMRPKEKLPISSRYEAILPALTWEFLLIVPMHCSRLPIFYSDMRWHSPSSPRNNRSPRNDDNILLQEHPSLHSHCGLWWQDMKGTVWCEANYPGQECWSRFTAILASLLIAPMYCANR